MNLQTFNGEVSEDIFQVRNRRDVLNYDTWSGALSVFDVRNLSARKCGSSTFREPRNLFEIRPKSRVYGCLGMVRRWLPLARLARLSEVMVLGITSPCKPLKTLVFLSKARLARLFPPMLTCTHACVRMRVIKNHAYRNGLKITSPNLANLASGFSLGARTWETKSIFPSHSRSLVSVSTLPRRTRLKLTSLNHPGPYPDAPNNQYCSECKYFAPDPFVDRALLVPEDLIAGECRRFPPIASIKPVVVESDDLQRVFPIVISNDWCGEFVSRIATFASLRDIAVDSPQTPTQHDDASVGQCGHHSASARVALER